MTTKVVEYKCSYVPANSGHTVRFKHHKFTTIRGRDYFCTRCGKKLEDGE